MKRGAEEKEEEEEGEEEEEEEEEEKNTEPTIDKNDDDDNNSNDVANMKQQFVIEIDDDDDEDLELLCTKFPSDCFKISSIEQIIKEENEARKPKTRRVYLTLRDPKQQREFRISILGCYEKCIITGDPWKKILDAAHIMPFRLVGSCLGTGILLEKHIHWLWDKYDLSIDPETWIIHLSIEASINSVAYKKYHQTKVSNNVIRLLEENAEIELLKMHHDKFLEMEKKRLVRDTKKRNNKNGDFITKKKKNSKPSKISKISLYDYPGKDSGKAQGFVSGEAQIKDRVTSKQSSNHDVIGIDRENDNCNVNIASFFVSFVIF
jgi:hypothetical protein